MVEHPDKTIGQIYGDLRKAAGITGEELATALGVRQPVISKKEHGRQPITFEDANVLVEKIKEEFNGNALPSQIRYQIYELYATLLPVFPTKDAPRYDQAYGLVKMVIENGWDSLQNMLFGYKIIGEPEAGYQTGISRQVGPGRPNIDRERSSFRGYMKGLRIDHQLTQEAMAKRLGISKPYLRKLEYGDMPPTSKLIHRIHKAFGVDRKELLDMLIQERFDSY